MTQPRVLFVSKPVAPPFHDGAVCLVRDMAPYLPGVRPTVLSTPSAPALAQGVDMDRIYVRRGHYAPAIQDNIRTLLHVLLDRRHDLWHFVFAPNPTSSRAASLLKGLRRRPVVQTVASRPRSFDDLRSLLFGDRIIALSKHTADLLVANGSPHVQMLPPPCADLSRDIEAQKLARSRADLPWGVPMLVYAGDLEFSSGARVMAQAADTILSEHKDVLLVFACRAKTPKAQQVADLLKKRLSNESRVRWVGEVDDLPALMASATAMPFPVDDLYGKVDLPYVLLEAGLLGVASIVARGGPLEQIPAAMLIDPDSPGQLARACLELLGDDDAAKQRGRDARQGVLREHDPARLGSQLADLYEQLLAVS
jgi:phosphatidylinositol alpha-1,6-mannosyltransferase